MQWEKMSMWTNVGVKGMARSEYIGANLFDFLYISDILFVVHTIDLNTFPLSQGWNLDVYSAEKHIWESKLVALNSVYVFHEYEYTRDWFKYY